MNQIAPAYDFLPHSIEAEQQLLGSVLMSNDSWDACGDVVEAAHFYEPIHARLWALISERLAAGQQVTPVTLIAQLGADGLVDLAGMTIKEYVARLAVEAAAPRHAPNHARVVRDLWARRQIIALTRDLQSRAMGMDGADVAAMLEEADAELAAIRFGKQVAGVCLLGDLADRALAQTEEAYRLESKVGFDTGVAAIDEMTGPFMPGDLITVLAPSGHGKSALGAQILNRNAEASLDANRGVPGLFLSMEMEGVQVARRQMASYSGIATRAQKAGEINEGEYTTLKSAAARLKRLPFYIDHSGRQKVSTITKKLRAMKKAYGIRIAVVDHVKLIKPESPKWSKFDTIENAAMELKDIAKEIDITVVLLAQVTRESQKRDGWRVRPGDLWGGDTVRECSDIMLTACLPHKWLSENEPEGGKEKEKWSTDLLRWAGRGEVSAPKVRDGETGNHRAVSFDGKRMLFGDL